MLRPNTPPTRIPWTVFVLVLFLWAPALLAQEEPPATARTVWSAQLASLDANAPAASFARSADGRVGFRVGAGSGPGGALTLGPFPAAGATTLALIFTPSSGASGSSGSAVQLGLEPIAPRGGRGRATQTLQVPRAGPDATLPLLISLQGLSARGRELSFADGVWRLHLEGPAAIEGAETPPVPLLLAVQLLGEAATPQDPESWRRIEAALQDDEGLHDHERARERSDAWTKLEQHFSSLPAERRVQSAMRWLKSSKNERLRALAREALGSMPCSPGPDLARALEAFRKEASKRMRRDEAPEWAYAIARSGTPECQAFCAEGLAKRRSADGVRAAFLRGLARRGPPLRTLLDAAVDATDRDWAAGAALADALAFSGHAAAVEALIELLEAAPKEGTVARRAAEGLARLLGRDLGLEAPAWRRFWKAREGVLPKDAEPGTVAGSSFYGVPVLPGRVAFVLDTSGSMREAIGGGRAKDWIEKAVHLKNAKIENRFDIAKAELVHALAKLPKGAHAGVVLYDTGITWVTKTLESVSPRLVKTVTQRLESLEAKERTNVIDAMDAAFHPKGKARDRILGPDAIFLLTDGAPSAGSITSFEWVRARIERWNLGRSVRLHTIQVGDRPKGWLADLAHGSGGRHADLSEGGARAPRSPR